MANRLENLQTRFQGNNEYKFDYFKSIYSYKTTSFQSTIANYKKMKLKEINHQLAAILIIGGKLII